MSKEINNFGAKQQIIYLNSELQKALKTYKAKENAEPFEYRHYGLLYPLVKRFYEEMGFAIIWHREDKDNLYWSFTLPKDAKIPDGLN